MSQNQQKSGDPRWTRAKFGHDNAIRARGGFWTMILAVLFCGGAGAVCGAAMYFEFAVIDERAIFVFSIIGFIFGAGMGFAFWREAKKA